MPQSAQAKLVQYNQWQKPDSIPDVFLASLNKQTDGSLSKPIIAGNGVHLLQLDKKQVVSRVQQQQQATEILTQQAIMQAIEKWVDSQEKDSFIKIMPKGQGQ